MHLFTPNHVHLIAACYPPSSSLLTAGPEYRPNAQEVSRLTYYAANRPGKINKLGSELEKRVRTECTKAQSGNVRVRALLLITLSIIRALTTECRRDISLLSPSIVACIRITVDALSSDLEVCARAASVFTAWCTYTDGHVIGSDATLTENYISILRKFSSQSIIEIKSVDHELTNRTRMVGLTALTGAVNSEALYSSSSQFKPQVTSIIHPLLFHLLNADLSTLDDRAKVIKENPSSPYLAEFRTRPPLERRAASIHLHVDGESGPSSGDVLESCLRAFSHLLQHSNGGQISHIMLAAFESLDALKGWERLEQCRWFAQKTCEWTQYQYRYAVPSQLVERLLSTQDLPVSTPQQSTLAAMVTTVFTSPVPLVNLSTSDIVSNLTTLVSRRVGVDPEDALLPALIECIASLGTHVYYSDQIQDLAGDLIGKIVAIETQGLSGRDRSRNDKSRGQAIRCLLAGLLGLMQAADNHEHVERSDEKEQSCAQDGSDLPRKTVGVPSQDPHTRISNRTRISPELWHDTLSLFCDRDYAVRNDYANAFISYLSNEVPKRGENTAIQRLTEGSHGHQASSINMLLFGDSTTRSLRAVHAYLYTLATASSLELVVSPSPSPVCSASGDGPVINILPTTPDTGSGLQLNGSDSRGSPPTSQVSERRSTATTARSRKASTTQRLLESTPSIISSSTCASLSDYALILHVMTVVQNQTPIRGLLTGLPMVLALHGATQIQDGADAGSVQRSKVIRELLTRVWLAIGQVWDCKELVDLAEKALSCMPEPSMLPSRTHVEADILSLREQVPFPPVEPDTIVTTSWQGVDAEEALSLIVSARATQEATGLDRQGLLRRFSAKWSAESALKDSVEPQTNNRAHLGEGISPLLRISPAFMAIDNLSLQSLTRSVRGVGVTDLREALEGRGNASNPALVRPPSVSTLDHTSFDLGANRLALTRSKSRGKRRAVTAGAGDVRDVLNKLGIGKQNGASLLKASFPPYRSDQRTSPRSPLPPYHT
ncbi:hypothetical protein SERLA73DRAFT_98316 [Serpula lacrymans var. lacrymans S7.3]|uniref:Protein EFR3 n=2 Tax=Serpula lacrymans var. lacrymans TaxID=341189 RepID=F8QF53_SERL3|nr:uncharacterized protein SERLADRAFT_354988 [Serpula lacrymans var. lacrymans S7.9]EGN93012.1 hypothetical protein SERLA73DRAFT_98316 [Serpula lacrymans var. lacrymans S7.3]EGO27852.1 hypothetical protein SERLADRAFT_354988 [Serpula lacrymans var. lacrymans S7.9]